MPASLIAVIEKPFCEKIPSGIEHYRISAFQINRQTCSLGELFFLPLRFGERHTQRETGGGGGGGGGGARAGAGVLAYARACVRVCVRVRVRVRVCVCVCVCGACLWTLSKLCVNLIQ